MTPWQVFNILRAQWRLVTVIFATVFLLAAAITFLLPKKYIATATVVVDAKAEPVSGMINPEQLSSTYLATQVNIATSQHVAQRVVKALKLDEVPQFQQQWRDATGGRGDFSVWLGSSLQRRLSVIPMRESNVIDISVEWPDARAAAGLANAFAKAYVDTTIELKVEPQKQYATWFDQRADELRADLEAKQKKLSDFQNQTGITSTEQHLDIENARLQELSTQLSLIQEQRQESQSHQKQLQTNDEAAPEVIQSPLVSGLQSSLAQAEARLKNLEVSLGKNHPDYQTAQAEVASLKSKIDQETGKIAESLGNVTQINVRREGDIRAALELQKRRVLEIKRERDKLDVLQSDVNNAQKNLDTVAQRLSQSSLESQLQQTNVLLLAAATEPTVPSSPHVRLNLLIGFVLGGVLGIAAALLLELIQPRVRSSEDLSQLLHSPLLGTIRSGQIKANKPAAPVAIGPARIAARLRPTGSAT